MFTPCLSVKFTPWRSGSPESKAADAAFDKVRPAVLASRRTESGFLICEGCGFVTATGDEKPFTPQGFFDLHHLDNDHANNQAANIAVACPFCHMPFHLGFNAMRGNGTLIFAPELSQADISRICAVSVIGFSRGDALSAKAKQSYHSLSLRGEALRKFFGPDFALNLSNYLLDRDRLEASGSGKPADDGLKTFRALRFLPDVESPDLVRAADYWRRVYQHCDIPSPPAISI
jgi:hypothetical protein